MLEFFSMSGRYGRTMFWLSMAISTGLSWLAGQQEFKKTTFENGFIVPDDGDPRFWLSAVLVVLAFWISAVGCIKRLHDRGKTGWWYLLLFVPVIGPLWALVALGLMPGTGRDDNGYGPRDGLRSRRERKTAAKEDQEAFALENRRRRVLPETAFKEELPAETHLVRRKQEIDRLQLAPSQRTGFGRRRYA
ncbi:DUF805 domain-containing protein [Zhengella sp. ZM62]|uniref:DUF805 domain-containing protein n=1 Tax=Zhengella sedimenti TaxID=3390035 RepID=UPI003976485E